VIGGIPTYVPATPTTPAQGLYPYGAAAGIYDLYESSGIFKQNQLIVNTNARINSKLTIFGYYAFGHAHADFSTAGPSNPYNFNADWGRSTFDIHHRVNINGTIVAPLGLRISPNINYSSAPPLNITQGVDEFGDTLFNSRPAFVPAGFTAPTCTTAIAESGTSCIVNTAKYGDFVINPKPGMTVIPINYGNAFGQITVNIRLSRTWGFGEKAAPTTNPRQAAGGGPGGGGGPRGGGFAGGGPRGGGGGGFAGGGRGGGGGGGASGQKYTLTAGVYVRNIFNTTNQGIPDGDLLSPRFGESLALASNGQGATQSANRRLEFNLRFGF
jgi:hypothetical protein